MHFWPDFESKWTRIAQIAVIQQQDLRAHREKGFVLQG